MEFTYSEEQRELKRTTIEFAQRELNDNVVQRDADRQFAHDLWLRCGRMGFQGLPVPERYGGSGFDPLTTTIALEALGYGCLDGGLTFSICAHLLATVVPIWQFGSEAQKERYLPGMCCGELIGVNAMSEPDAGSDAFALKTTAVAKGDGYLLNGLKIFGSNAPVADVAVVFAATDSEKGMFGGVTAFIVEKQRDGFESGQTFEKMGLRTSPMGELVFDDLYVPADAVLGGVGGGAAVFVQAMDWERVCLYGCHVGTMERLLDQTIAYARTRKQFDQPIGKFQAISHRIADMKVRLEAARLLVYKAASQLEKGRRASLDASIAKLFVSEAFVEMALDAVQIHGGYGYMTEYQIERILRDAVGSKLYSGTSEIQRNIISRWLGL